jgi:hypothetical protein
MANNSSGKPGAQPAELAMNRVLQAERDAEQAVRDCEAQAGRMLLEAQARANRISSRTDERITLIQMRSYQQVAAQIKQLEHAESIARQEQEQSYRIDETGLAECIEEIAVYLTGGARPGTGDGETTE